jgi:predicted Holliday junction resolvase-like endonuclease
VDSLEFSVEHCEYYINFYVVVVVVVVMMMMMMMMLLQALADLNRMLENHVSKLEEDLQHQHQHHTQPVTAAGGGAAATGTEHVTQ